MCLYVGVNIFHLHIHADAQTYVYIYIYMGTRRLLSSGIEDIIYKKNQKNTRLEFYLFIHILAA